MTDTKAIKQRFNNSIRRGTGEAHLIMQNNPSIDFSTAIIKASLNHYADDPQAEGSRAFYLSELITLSKQKNKICQAILKGLANEQDDTWVLVQLFDLAAFFAKQGDKTARQAIYDRFYNKIIYGSGWCGYRAIIDLDALEGLKYIASTFGKAIEKDPEMREDSFIVDHFQKKYPEINARQELKKAGKKDRFIKFYLNNIEQTEKNRKKYRQEHPRPAINYITITERINNNASVPVMWAKDLSNADLKKLADDLLQQTDRLKLEKYLRIFNKAKYPYDYKPILALAKSRNKKNDRLVYFASGALQYFKGTDIRKFAIEKLKQTNRPDDYLNLLVSNYKNGDSKLLTTIAQNCKNERETHALVWSYINIFKANKTKTCKRPLEAIYAKLNCGMHRYDIVQILKDNNVLSKQLKQEIRYDSDEDTRKLA